MKTPSIFSLRAGVMMMVITTAFLMLASQARADDVTATEVPNTQVQSLAIF